MGKKKGNGGGGGWSAVPTKQQQQKTTKSNAKVAKEKKELRERQEKEAARNDDCCIEDATVNRSASHPQKENTTRSKDWIGNFWTRSPSDPGGYGDTQLSVGTSSCPLVSYVRHPLIGIIDVEGHCFLHLLCYYRGGSRTSDENESGGAGGGGGVDVVAAGHGSIPAYLAFCLWRKMLVMLHSDPQYVPCQEENFPSLISTRHQPPGAGEEEDHTTGEVVVPPAHTHFNHASHWGIRGLLNKLHLLVQRERRAFEGAHKEEEGRGGSRTPLDVVSISQRYDPSSSSDRNREKNYFFEGVDPAGEKFGDFFANLVQQNQRDVLNLLLLWGGGGDQPKNPSSVDSLVDLTVEWPREYSHSCGTALALACRWGHTKLASWLISLFPAAVLQGKQDALMAAAQVGRLASSVEAIRILVTEGGADPNIGNRDHSTPLHLAAVYGYDPAVKVLVELGADIWAVDDAGETALFTAVFAGHLKAAKELLAAAAAATAAAEAPSTRRRLLEVADPKGNTVLHALGLGVASGWWYPKGNEYSEICDFLLEQLKPSTRDLNTQNSEGKTPLDVVEFTQCEKLWKMLAKAGGKRGK